MAVSGVSGSHVRQCQGSPGSCQYCPEPQSGQEPAGTPTSFNARVPGVADCHGKGAVLKRDVHSSASLNSGRDQKGPSPSSFEPVEKGGYDGSCVHTQLISPLWPAVYLCAEIDSVRPSWHCNTALSSNCGQHWMTVPVVLSARSCAAKASTRRHPSSGL